MNPEADNGRPAAPPRRSTSPRPNPSAYPREARDTAASASAPDRAASREDARAVDERLGAPSAKRFSARGRQRASASGAERRPRLLQRQSDGRVSLIGGRTACSRSDDLRSNASRSFAVCAARSAATDSLPRRASRPGRPWTSATSSLGANADGERLERDEGTSRRRWRPSAYRGSLASPPARARSETRAGRARTRRSATRRRRRRRRRRSARPPRRFRRTSSRVSRAEALEVPSAVPARPRIVATSRGASASPSARSVEAPHSPPAGPPR